MTDVTQENYYPLFKLLVAQTRVLATVCDNAAAVLSDEFQDMDDKGLVATFADVRLEADSASARVVEAAEVSQVPVNTLRALGDQSANSKGEAVIDVERVSNVEVISSLDDRWIRVIAAEISPGWPCQASCWSLRALCSCRSGWTLRSRRSICSICACGSWRSTGSE